MSGCKAFLRVRLLALLVALFAFAPLFGQSSAPQPPATIYLIRHAEKLTDGREDLSWHGFVRAAAIPRLFLSPVFPGEPQRTLLSKPEFLFATAPSKHSNRPFETIMPLSSALNLTISNGIANDDFAQLAALLLSGKYAGKIVLVAWHHGNLPKLAAALGATPPYAKWPEAQFDRVWRIDYADGKATLSDLPQELLPGDSK
jgi:uncharacterized protein YbjT (DUF2867 family)